MRMLRTLILAVFIAGAAFGSAVAQPAGPTPQQGAACPPGAGPNAPAVGQGSDKPLSDQLADSKGVICPPAGVDSQMQKPPPEGGALKVIPPPGSPGGNPDVQPK